MLIRARNTAVPIGSWSEPAIVGCLCVLAALHVFVFAAAFPLFNNVDEPAHFDLVYKYADNSPPERLEPFSLGALARIAVYSGNFYLGSPADSAMGEPMPPPWKLPAEVFQPLMETRLRELQAVNYESTQPPLYYALAGGWWRAIKIFHPNGLHHIYWLRFFNAFIVAGLVWLSWRTATIVFPGNIFIRLGVPALITFLPQTAFYSINNDILSPLCCGASFWLLLKLLEQEMPTLRLAALAGLTLAAAGLTKISNAPFLAIAFIFLALFFLRHKRVVALPALAAFTVGVVLPLSVWAAWNKIHFGDFTGSAAKITALGWTVQPCAAWLHHPLLTLSGAWSFFSELIGRFWQGEFTHHLQPLTLPAANLFYVLLTMALLALVAGVLAFQPGKFSPAQRRALWLSLSLFAGAVGFMAWLSVRFDFHNCYYPSRAKPWFTSGRLMLGALVPFALVLLTALDLALARCRIRVKFTMLLLLLFAMLGTEVMTDLPAFYDSYNWFHN
jgi:4-amino-4-deoxy-L-arabinose transferase-like glycosyltransferase